MFAESKNGGFTFHEKTPSISSSQINPAQDSSDPILESVVVAQSIQACPMLSVSSLTSIIIFTVHKTIVQEIFIVEQQQTIKLTLLFQTMQGSHYADIFYIHVLCTITLASSRG